MTPEQQALVNQHIMMWQQQQIAMLQQQLLQQQMMMQQPGGDSNTAQMNPMAAMMGMQLNQQVMAGLNQMPGASQQPPNQDK